LLISPYPRALYFPAEHLSTVTVLAALFGVCWLVLPGRRGFLPGWSALDWAVLSLPAAYAISLIVAANPREAVEEALKFSGYFALYWLISRLAVGDRRREACISVLLASGLGVALVGLAAFTGVVEVLGGVIGGRLASTLQYPNTTAAYLTALLVLVLGRWARRGSAPSGWLLAGAGSLLVTALTLTLSRGGWLVLPPAAAVLLWALPSGARLRTAGRLVLVLATGVLAAALTAGAVGRGEPGGAWLWLAGGAVIATVIAAGASRISLRPQLRRRTAIAFGLAAAGTLAALWSRLAPLVAPVAARFAGLATDVNFLARLLFNYDGLAILLDRPLLGAGGGGWRALYHGYQSFTYFTAYAHNFVLDHGIATGLVGLAALGFLALTFARVAIRLSRANAAGRVEVAAMLAASATIGLHSLVDFTLALPAMGLFLFSQVGLVRSMELKQTVVPDPRRRPIGVVALGAAGALLALVTAASLLQGHLWGQRGIDYLRADRVEEARYAFERALAADPLQATFAMDLASCYETLGAQRSDPEMIAEARRLFETGVRLDRYNPFYHQVLGSFYLRHGHLTEGMASLERAVELSPTMARSRGALARAQALMALHDLERGDRPTAIRRAQVALAQMDAAEAARARIPAFVPEVLRLWDSSLDLSAGQAHSVLGDFPAALDPLGRVPGGSEYRGEALVWMGMARALGGLPGAEEYINAGLTLDPRLAADLNRWLAALQAAGGPSRP
jgi:tetratricopeptide (TPR) repeat protein/O-antigen ligase